MVGSPRVWEGALRLGARLAVAGALVLAVGAGCAGKTKEPAGAELCPELCKKGKDCEAAPAVTSCDDFCLGEDARAEETGCHDLYDAAENCLAKLDDICTGTKACANEINATSACELSYCSKHSSEVVCTVPKE